MGQVIVSLGNFVSTVLAARILGVEDFGIFVTLWLSSLFIIGCCSSLTSMPFATEYQKLKARGRNLYFSGVVYSVFLYSVFFSLLGGAIGGFLISGSYYEFAAIFFYIFLNSVQDNLRRVFVVIGFPHIVLSSDVLLHGLRILVLYSFLGADVGFVFVCSIYALVAFFSVVVFFVLYGFDWSGSYLKSIVYNFNINKAHSRWLFMNNALQWTSVNIFVLAAAIFISPSGVAAIRAFQSIMAALNVAVQSAEMYLPLAISRQHDNLEKVFSKVFSYVLYGSLCFSLISFLMFFFGDYIVELLFGEEYSSIVSGGVFLYSLSYIFIYLSVPLKAYFRVVARSKVIFNAYVLSSIFSIALVYPLETLMSVSGALFGVIISAAIIALYLLYLFVLDFLKYGK